jgi:hypothetical protein
VSSLQPSAPHANTQQTYTHPLTPPPTPPPLPPHPPTALLPLPFPPHVPPPFFSPCATHAPLALVKLTQGDGLLEDYPKPQSLNTKPYTLIQGDGLPVDFGNKLLSSLSLSSDIGPQEFLTLVRGKSTSAENSDKMLTAARLDLVEVRGSGFRI